MNVLMCLPAGSAYRAAYPHRTRLCPQQVSTQALKRSSATAESYTVQLKTNVHGYLVIRSRRSIVHRDVKPDNIMLHLPVEDLNDLQRIIAKLLDFGIAAVTEKGGNMRDTMVTGTTGLAAQIGTPLFMSPEAFGTGAVDERTDIWAIGVTAFVLITGTFPFADKEADYSDVLVAVKTQDAR